MKFFNICIMSKLANKPISYPKEVKVYVDGGALRIEGRSMTKLINISGFNVAVDDSANQCMFTRLDDDKFSRSMLGTAVANFKNALLDVANETTVTVNLIGVGFKAIMVSKIILLWVGYSHLYGVELPDGVKAVIKDNNKIILQGSLESVTLTSSLIEKIRKWDPCMQKGIVTDGKYLIKKEGKKKK